MYRASLVLLALAFVGCADRTALLVEVSSPDLAIPGDIDSLTIRARTPRGAMFDQTFDVNMGWPHSITIRPAASDDQGQVFVEVTGNHAGAFVVRRVALTAFEPGATRRVDITLQRSCVDVRCADDVDCVAGSCVGVALDGGVDGGGEAGVDASMPPDADVDAATFDARLDDAGVIDSGGVDAGTDAGSPDTGTDAGTDAGIDSGPRDAGTDTGPVDAGSDCTGIACRGTVVISELTTQGPGGGTDEFIELYNRGTGTATLGGCVFSYYSASGVTRTVRATLPAGAMVQPHGYYLAASAGYAGLAADFVWPSATGSADAGGTITLECGGSSMIVDRIGYGTAALAETAAIMPAMSPSGSYERKANAGATAASMSSGGADEGLGNGEDTDHNELDLVVRATRDPQSSASPTEP